MRYLQPMMILCTVCRQPKRTNTFGTVYNDTFAITFGSMVCNDCCGLLHMMYEEITEEVRAGKDTPQPERIEVLIYRLRNNGAYPEGPLTPKLMVEDLLKDIDKGESE